MSEHNYAGMAFKANLEKNPDLMTVDVAKIDQSQKTRRDWEAKNNPPKPEPVKVEYNKLRKQLFDLQQCAKGSEVRVNDAVATVRHFEVIITNLLTQKKAATTDGRLGDERGCEHLLVAAESDLQNARENLAKWQKENSATARELRTWQADNGARLTALEKQI